MNTRVLVFAGSRSQLLQHIPVEHTVRSFRAWEPRLVLSSEKNDHALWAPLLENYDITPCHRLGPAPASVARINYHYRCRLTLSCVNTRRLRELLAFLVREFAKDRSFRGVGAFVDVNGRE